VPPNQPAAEEPDALCSKSFAAAMVLFHCASARCSSLVTRGMRNKIVGSELGISDKTIKVHRARVMEKMQAESLADLVRMASALQIHEKAAADVR
jgi:FixJ family two-component response regulator